MGPCGQWRHHQTWPSWGSPPSSCRNGDRSSRGAPGTCRRYGRCGNPTRASSRCRSHRVIQDDDLGVEVLRLLGWIVLGVGGNVATTDVLDRHVLHVETNVVTGAGLGEGLVVHLDGFDLG